ncbi:Pycsar system effector family protein [Nonomuraea sediminis]|uniref:Pycsar system effector family protein n=1 Tax=Nonomuraea sediminis TaxID=2835864 RepID=UPI001BDDA6CE|nr:Pycsar system effector family protein [Nonomuraea sediminis]
MSEEIAWRLLGHVSDATGKVDAKAAFALTLQSAVLAAVVALSPPPSWEYWAGVALLAASVALSVYSVMPRIGVWRRRPRDFVYFGHLRRWDPRDLRNALEAADAVDALCRQAVTLSRIAWRKHLLVGLSLWLAAAGAALVAAPALLTRL